VIPRRLTKAIVSQHSDKFLDETVKFWEPRVQRDLSREDARQITENLSGFFRLLLEWDAQQQVRHDIVPCAVSDGSGELPMPSGSSKLKALTSPR
jgi:hypothetical protein